VRLTERDVRLVRDIALSHALSRDQIIGLGYFSSVTRANTRLREMASQKLVRSISTPFHSQNIYSAGACAKEVVGERISRLLGSRSDTPRFLRHALCTTSIRLLLCAVTGNQWRFEQQARVRFDFMGTEWDVRPDGLIVSGSGVTAIETDLGHTPAPKFSDRFRAYQSLAQSKECLAWGFETFSLLIVTTGPLRARHLRRLAPREPGFALSCESYDQLGVPFAGSWS
jgi:Replication-relaxation